MPTELPDIGNVPSAVEPELRRFLLRLREHVRELRGSTGDPGGRAGSGSGSGGSTTVIVGGGGAGGGGVAVAPDLTSPPAPSTFTLVSGFDFVGITTPAPVFTAGGGYARTRVYAAKYTTGPLPVFTDAVLVTEFVGEVGAFDSPANTTWRVWLKWRSLAGVDSTVAGGTNGFTTTTGQDLALLLSALNGQINTAQLSTTLAGTISTLQTDVATLNSTATWSSVTAYSIGANVKYGGKLYRALTATTNNQPDISPTQWQKVGDYDSLSGTVAAHTASIADQESRITTNTSGLAAEVSSRTALAAVVNNGTTGLAPTYAAVQTEIIARAASDATLFARYAVKLDVNGFVTGWEQNNNGTSGNFNVLATTFSVRAPGQNPLTPFIVRTVGQTENGVFIPPGIYADAAYIVNLQAMIAKFGTAAITNAMIQNLSADKVTTGSIAVGNVISSSNYTPSSAGVGGSGWQIRGDGTMEMLQGIFRGNIYANAGFFRGDVTGAQGILRGGVRSDNFTGFAWPDANAGNGYYLGPGGLLLGNYNNWANNGVGGFFQVEQNGDLYTPNLSIIGGVLRFNGSGTFSGIVTAPTINGGTVNAATINGGTINGTTGTFNGVLNAETVNAVSTLNLRGDAVTLPRGDSISSNIGVSSTETIMMTVSLDSLGAPIFVNYTVIGAHLPTSGTSAVTLNVRINGATPYASKALSVNGSVFSNTPFDWAGGVFIQSPGVGPTTITLTAFGTTARLSAGSALFAIGLKR